MRSKRGRKRGAATPPVRRSLWADILAVLWLAAVVGAYLVYGFPGTSLAGFFW